MAVTTHYAVESRLKMVDISTHLQPTLQHFSNKYSMHYLNETFNIHNTYHSSVNKMTNAIQ